ncbi:MAG: dephospho-CoA kinase [Pseudomonadota bacterium]
MITLGLTGSIGMGKSTTAEMFRARGVPVWDADAAVHMIYSVDGAGTKEIAKIYPEAIGAHGVDREALRTAISEDPAALERIEAVIHPLIAADRVAFLETQSGKDVVLLDIPLLFETGADQWLDKVVVVSTSPEIQSRRVLERTGMTKDLFDMILAKQVPDTEKRARADFIVDTTDMDTANRDVDHILEQLKGAEDA